MNSMRFTLSPRLVQGARVFHLLDPFVYHQHDWLDISSILSTTGLVRRTAISPVVLHFILLQSDHVLLHEQQLSEVKLV